MWPSRAVRRTCLAYADTARALEGFGFTPSHPHPFMPRHPVALAAAALAAPFVFKGLRKMGGADK